MIGNAFKARYAKAPREMIGQLLQARTSRERIVKGAGTAQAGRGDRGIMHDAW